MPTTAQQVISRYMATKSDRRRCNGGDDKCYRFFPPEDSVSHLICKSCRGNNCNKDTCDNCKKWYKHKWKLYDQCLTHLAVGNEQKEFKKLALAQFFCVLVETFI